MRGDTEDDLTSDLDGDTPRETDGAAARQVFYDGGCPICRAEIAMYRKAADPAIDWRDVDAEDFAPPRRADGAAVRRDELLARFHVRRRDGTLVSGVRAFLAIWRATPKLAFLGRLLDRQPFIAVGEGLYWAFLKLRPLWRPSSPK